MRLTHLLIVAPLAGIAVNAALDAGWSGLARHFIADETTSGRRVDHFVSRRGHGRRRQRQWHPVNGLSFGSTLTEKPVSQAEPSVELGSTKVQTLDGAEDIASDSSFLASRSRAVGRFFLNIKTSTTNLWTNYKVCQDIRRRVKDGHEITYSEFACLQRGRQDRGKLVNLAFMMVFVPEYLPFMMFSSMMLPSTFDTPEKLAKNHERCSVQRVNAVLSGLAQLEEDLLKKRKREELEKLKACMAGARQMLEANSKSEVFEKFQDYMVTTSFQTKKLERVAAKQVASSVPPPAIRGLAKGMGIHFPFAPTFYLRMKLRGFTKELSEADAVLRQHSLDILSQSELHEACNARGIDATGLDQGRLRKSLREWLRLTSEPIRELPPGTVFLPDQARLLGLGLNFVDTVRMGKHAELSRKACSVSAV